MVKKVVATTYPYDRPHDMYQEYYRNALKATLATQPGGVLVEVSSAFSTTLLRKLRAVRHSYRLRHLFDKKILLKMIDLLARILSRGPVTCTAPPIGAYRFQTDQGQNLRVAIDANDFPTLSETALATSDIYFKSNYWPSMNHPAKVLPLPNMNPLVGQNLEFFRGLRNTPKERDLFVFFRLWGGRDELEGIEHNMALIKALSKANCNSYLLAYLVAGDIPSQAKRLDDLGVNWTTTAMPPMELWQNAASARLNLVRMGMHECMPWRMIDILSMGGVPVMDYTPPTRWPEPLIEGKHYLNLNFPPGCKNSTSGVAEQIDRWLQQDALVPSIGHNTAAYFDQFLAPQMLGNQIIRAVEDWQAAQPIQRKQQ